MMRRFSFGLQWKLNLLIGAILLVTMAAFVGLDLSHERRSLIAARAQHLEVLAQHFAWVIRRAGSQPQQELVMNYESAINENGNHEYRTLILDARSEVLAATNPDLLGTLVDNKGLLRDYQKLDGDPPTGVFIQDTSRMVAVLPVLVGTGERREERQPLTIMIFSSLGDIRESVKASLVTHIVHLLFTALAMMTVINLALSRLVLQPIRNLLASMNRMAQGEWKTALPIRSRDEIGRLTKGYNALGRNLEQTVRRLVRAEKLASVALVAIHLNRELRKPIEQIRCSARFLCRHNAFDGESSHAVGRIFDQTERMYAISEKFNEDFGAEVEDEERQRRNETHSWPPVDHAGVVNE